MTHKSVEVYEKKRHKLMEFWLEDYPECEKRRFLEAFMRYSWRVYAHQNS